MLRCLAAAAVLVLSCQVLSARRGKDVPVPTPVVPRHEVSIGIGLSPLATFTYSGPFTSGKVRGALLVQPYSVGYTYHFGDRWGLQTGFEVSMRSILLQGEGTFPVEGGAPKEFDSSSSDASLLGLTVPVMGQWMAPVGGKGIRFYAQAGARFTVYTVQSSLQALTSSEGMPPTGIEKNYVQASLGKADVRPFNVGLGAETGFRLPIWGKTGVYAGVFGNIDLVRPFKYKGVVPVYYSAQKLQCNHFFASEEAPGSGRPMVGGLLPFSVGAIIRVAF